jgi:multicomponent Na+:H+ antiporter subunit D
MSLDHALIGLALLIPLFAAGAIKGVGRAPDVRETVTVFATLALVIVTGALMLRTGQGLAPSLKLVEPLPGIALAFRLEPLGALFAAMAAVLWAINSVFSIGYMRGRQEANQTRFYICFALAMAAVMGVAMAANLFTLFVFYEALTLATYPLVTHAADKNGGDKAARDAGRIYLGVLVGASVTLLLPAIIAIQVFAGTTEFTAGGVLLGKVGPALASILMLLVFFGTAKAALIPMHVWLPRAMVAPTPVSAMLHAVAVVKAGVFTLLKCSAYIFGPAVISTAPAAQWLLWIAAGTIVIASLVAMTKDELKARLAWSTVGQLAYIVSGALLPAWAGVVGGGLHMLTHAFGKITLFMCAGAIYVATGVQRVSQMRGLGRRMPIVFVCFAIGSLSVIGLPPAGGVWSKFLLVTASFGVNQPWTAWAMIASSLLSVAYLLPVAIMALAPTRDDAPVTGAGAAPLTVAPLVMTAAGTLALFVLAEWAMAYLLPVAGNGGEEPRVIESAAGMSGEAP